MRLTDLHRLGQFAAAVGLLVPSLTASPLTWIAIPSSQWGTQYYYTSLSAVITPPRCSNGFGNPGGADTCTQSTSYLTLSGSETVSAYNDANGIHLYAQSFASNTENGVGAVSATGWAEAEGRFVDTLTNNSAATAGFQLAFHMDGSLQAEAYRWAKPAGSYNYTLVGTDQAYLDIQFWGATSGGLLQLLQEWEYNPSAYSGAVNLAIDQDYVTNTILLAPGQSYDYRISAYIKTAAESRGYGSMTGTANMANTLTVTSLSVFDELNNPLPVSLFASSGDVNYGSTPEPGSLVLLALPGAALLLRARRRE